MYDENKISQNMDDQQILTDMLTSQKQISGAYNTFGSECEHETLKCDFLNILRDEHNMQSGVFSQMQQHGWYQTTAAQQSKISEAKTKYQNVSAQLC